MILAIDIGNTTIALGIFVGQQLVRKWRLRSEQEKTADEYTLVLLNLLGWAKIKEEEISGVIISSVVPPLTPVFQKVCRQLFGRRALVVGPGLKTGMAILYENPQEVGADRVVAAVAAFAKYGGPVIVVDFGTATTFDAISAKGEYLGGAIAPGIEIAAQALYEKTAKLPRIEIKKPLSVIGKTTETSMQAGLYFGYKGLIEGLIAELQQDLGPETKVVMTGGYAELFFPQQRQALFYEPDLVLEGLRLLYEKNRR
ncbi:MAG: type III pantothenate kinase [Candidatus Aminicenantes bacterium]|nr:type III pantothenate kinase [Candidatus Aminicenantes bacterium]RLE03276.1 MAG: type III pantothenate kinase [Candidatus Aminicenantes bacterium]RLE06259.1 MAG: type III pantothenate kinase [Candidatus Aminicenantes bacterium]